MIGFLGILVGFENFISKVCMLMHEKTLRFEFCTWLLCKGVREA